MTLLILLFCLYLPFQVALNPTDGVDLASIRVAILGLFFLWLANSLKNRKLVVRSNIITALLVIFLFLSLFSAFFSQNSDWSIRKLLYLFSVFPIYFVVSGHIDSREDSLRAIKALVISGVVASFIGLIQCSAQFFLGLDQVYSLWAKYAVSPFLGRNLTEEVLANPSWLVNISGKTYLRATSIFPDPHMFSLYLGLLFPLAAGLAITTKKKGWFIAAIIIFTADLLSFSRGAYAGLVGAAIFLAIVSWKKFQKKIRWSIALSASAVVLLLAAPSPISSRFWSSFNLEEGSNVGRMEMWNKAVEVIKTHPIVGVGIGNYSLEVDPLADYRNSIYAHNVYLDVAAETGLLTGLIWLGILVFAITRLIRYSKNDPLYLFVALSLVIFAFHSVFENGLYWPVNLALVLILIGLSAIDPNEKMAES
jgi:O-antigen ligase